MLRRRPIPVARLTALAALVVGAVVVARGVSTPRWRTLAPGAEFTTLRGEPFARRGPASIGVLRLDPARVELKVRHYTDTPALEPMVATAWLAETGGFAVFNAGQYYRDMSYMGVLVGGGDTLSSRPHATFQGLLVAEPDSGAPAAHVLDLRDAGDSARATARAWKEIAQSFMLFDRSGTVRVRRSDLVSNRTIVAEDRHGRVLVIVTEGGYTLWELARVLMDSHLELALAMSMDGGFESVLCVQAPGFRYASFGDWDGGRADAQQVPLPAVIVARARVPRSAR